MRKYLFYFRPGEEARMLARCQFGIAKDGVCGASFTYPIKGYPWRRNLVKSYEFQISEQMKALLFAEVQRIRIEHPSACLASEQLWNDFSEKANAITRDRDTDKLCYTIGIFLENGEVKASFSMREDSEALVNSELYKIIAKLVEPYEKR